MAFYPLCIAWFSFDFSSVISSASPSRMIRTSFLSSICFELIVYCTPSEQSISIDAAGLSFKSPLRPSFLLSFFLLFCRNRTAPRLMLLAVPHSPSSALLRLPRVCCTTIYCTVLHATAYRMLCYAFRLVSARRARRLWLWQLHSRLLFNLHIAPLSLRSLPECL